MRAGDLGRAAVLVAGLVIANGAAASPKTRKIFATPLQMLSLAEDMVRHGKSDDAQIILELLARDPDPDVRNEARYRRSKLLKAEGHDHDAAVLLRRILDEEPNATPVRIDLAQLLDRMGDKDAAWREIRAAQAAGLPPAVARLVDRYSEALRAQRPMGASFEIALAPDSNISRATRSDTLGTVFGDFTIDNDSKARSGTGLALQGQAYRRFALAGDNSLLIRASGFGDLYRKTRFNDVAFDLAAGPELRWRKDRLTVELGASGRWYGQKPYQRSARLGATWTHALGPVTQLRLSGSAALIDNRINDLQDGKAYSGQASVERALSPTTGIGLTLGIDRQSLQDPGYSTTGWRIGALAWRDIGRATLTAEAQYGWLAADRRLLLFPDKRSDRYLKLSLGATFRRLTFAGFAPITRLVVERNRSPIEFYDYKRTRTEFGITRAF